MIKILASAMIIVVSTIQMFEAKINFFIILQATTI